MCRLGAYVLPHPQKTMNINIMVFFVCSKIENSPLHTLALS
jgi:hypothetical protein